MKRATISGLTQCILLVCGVAISTVRAESGPINLSPAAAAFNKFDPQKLQDIYYVDGADFDDIEKLSKIRRTTLDQGYRYLIDLGKLGETQKKTARRNFEGIFGVSFPEDLLFISRYRNELIYTPLHDLNVANLEVAVHRSDNPTLSQRGERSLITPIADQAVLPHISFYVDVNRPISDRDCMFPISQFWEHGNRSFCKNANISLVYRVNLFRSLAFGSGGSSTPDAKLVRISLDEGSTGAGIQLNNGDLGWTRSVASYIVADGWLASHSTDAIAKNYSFTVTATDDAAASGQSTAILKTHPASNHNVKYEKKEVSSFEIGVTGGVEVNKDGPKFKIEPRFSLRQDRWLSYSTEDYRIVRSSPNEKQVSFIWEREQYPTAESLMKVKTSPIWDTHYPIDRAKINPVGYRGFTPNFDVIYKAPSHAKGVTKFALQSSVTLWAIYDGVYSHYYLIGAHKSYQAQDAWQKHRTISEYSNFNVNWDHAVFTGGRPVNLQLGNRNSACIALGQDDKVAVETCNLKSTAQSFIYDQYGRYVSAGNTDKCLDGNDLMLFRPCDASLSQRWNWMEDSAMLENLYMTGNFMAYNASSNQVTLANAVSPTVSTRIITGFTDIFNQ